MYQIIVFCATVSQKKQKKAGNTIVQIYIFPSNTHRMFKLFNAPAIPFHKLTPKENGEQHIFSDPE